MRTKPRKQLVALAMLVCGTMFAGPCGITSLQLRDFVASTAIRTAVTTVAGIVEATIIQDQSTTTE